MQSITTGAIDHFGEQDRDDYPKEFLGIQSFVSTGFSGPDDLSRLKISTARAWGANERIVVNLFLGGGLPGRPTEALFKRNWGLIA